MLLIKTLDYNLLSTIPHHGKSKTKEMISELENGCVFKI